MECSRDNNSLVFKVFLRYVEAHCLQSKWNNGLMELGVDGCSAKSTTTANSLSISPSDLSSLAPDTKEQNDEIYRYVESVIYSRIIVTICLLGVLGNALNLVVLTCILAHKTMDRMERSATVSLLALAVSDLFFCLAVTPYAVTDLDEVLHDRLSFHLVFGVYQGSVISTFITSSTWLTVSMAVCRYLAICYPLQARSLIGMKLAVASIVFVFVFSVFLNLPRFWYQSIACVQPSANATDVVYLAVPGYLRQHEYLEQAYYVSYLLVGIIVPLCILGYCNYFLIQALRHSTRMRREFSRRGHFEGRQRSQSSGGDSVNQQCSTHIITLTLTIIVILYAVLVSPAEICNIFTYLVHSQVTVGPVYNLVVAIANALQTVNFSFNFVLYCVINVSFRRIVCDIVTCRAWHLIGRKRKTKAWAAGATSSTVQSKMVVVWNQDSRRSANGGTRSSVLRATDESQPQGHEQFRMESLS